MEVIEYLERAVEDNAADVFLIAGGHVSEKVDRHIRLISQERLLPAQTEQLIAQLYELAGRSMDQHGRGMKDNFSLSVPGLARFRVNVFHQRGSLAAVVRVIQFGIPNWQQMGISDRVMSLAKERRGLILVTGLAGSGKSVTQACLIDEINRSRDCHIITVENPIEYLHRNQRSIVSQQEVAIDVEDTESAMRDCLLQSPDVIFLSEMQTPEVIRTAITAAETGRLVIGTLYTRDAISAIDYVIHSFPAEQQETVRMQLSMVLCAAVSQQLLPAVDGGMVAAFELMRVNRNIQSMIREQRLDEIEEEILAGSRSDMLSMDQSLLKLYNDERISKETALEHAINAESMRRKMWVIRA